MDKDTRTVASGNSPQDKDRSGKERVYTMVLEDDRAMLPKSAAKVPDVTSYSLIESCP